MKVPSNSLLEVPEISRNKQTEKNFKIKIFDICTVYTHIHTHALSKNCFFSITKQTLQVYLFLCIDYDRH